MSYRDDLEAAKLRIHGLERKLSALEKGVETSAQVASLRRDLAAQQRRVAALSLTRRQLRVVFAPAGQIAILYGISVLLAMSDMDATSWWLTTASLAVGLVAPVWVWGLVRQGWPALIALACKLIALVSWAAGWWAPSYSAVVRDVDSVFGLFDASFYFFWLAPPLVLLLTLVEGATALIFASRRELVRPEQG